ncbi:AGCS family amino acid carrier protein [Gammaproteobacteria bacterium]|nr:AGCS family amino acid carrier protein [Gammaproteobacteria bacterium]MCH9854151.1 AGCS family amino acid carrier protein [Gammaproteobacteria bacterium]MDA8794152.1 AGCS family amino acid carrier protein [Gammaproteobacteria bacterium]MDA9870908.1 AGCS family amino acid carrier protein [Gammaproteobacteria bacterium]MDB2484373.1 AGCS family amino acid carrier protein [Gammaproteobacteria bacterium]
MDAVNDLLILIDSYLGSAVWFPFLLLSVGIFFTLYLGFPQIRYFKHAIGITTGRFDKDGAKGDTSHFQALATALSGTVGTGNIGGVALALHLGGPAALFWMWVTAFFGMTSKFVEVTLSHKYREQTADGTMAGGPMYYMEKGMNAKWLAIIFAMATVLSSFGTGSLPQINSIAAGLQSTFDIEPIVTGAVLSVLLALVIIGGIKRIAAVAAAIVPTMAIIYIVGAFAVILPNLGNIGPSFAAIFSDAFTGSAATGGFLGATFAYVFDRGVNRGLYSNEAGQGSAPIAHASARTDEPADEGMVSILEPFIDTIVICTITGLVILSSGAWKEKFVNEFQRADMRFVAGAYSEQEPADVAEMFSLLNGDDTVASLYSGELIISEGRAVNSQDFTLMASRSFAEEVVFARGDVLLNGTLSVTGGRLDDSDVGVSGMSLIHSVPLTTVAFTRGYFGEYGQYVVSVGLMLFAFSTAIAWSYYGDRAMTYLLGPKSVLPYRIVYVAGFFYAAFADTTIIWNLALITIVLMTVPNLFGLLFMHKEMKKTVTDYWEKTEHGKHKA